MATNNKRNCIQLLQNHKKQNAFLLREIHSNNLPLKRTHICNTKHQYNWTRISIMQSYDCFKKKQIQRTKHSIHLLHSLWSTIINIATLVNKDTSCSHKGTLDIALQCLIDSNQSLHAQSKEKNKIYTHAIQHTIKHPTDGTNENWHQYQIKHSSKIYQKSNQISLSVASNWTSYFITKTRISILVIGYNFKQNMIPKMHWF